MQYNLHSQFWTFLATEKAKLNMLLFKALWPDIFKSDHIILYTFLLSLDTYTKSALSPSFNSPSILNFYKNLNYYQFFGYANISFETVPRIRNPELADGPS
jgi:hypothetical protein